MRIHKGRARLSSDFSDKRVRTEIVLKSNFHNDDDKHGGQKNIKNKINEADEGRLRNLIYRPNPW